jgi:hypothetical protein
MAANNILSREKNKNISKMEKDPSLPFHEWIFYTDQSVRDDDSILFADSI